MDLKFLDEIKAKNDIVEVVGKYIPLTRRGSNFWGLCPFHHEKTPSFCVNGIDQFYYCFGCHKGGDVISFVKEIESVDYIEAVRILADRAKIPMPESQTQSKEIADQKKKKDRLLSLNREAAAFYVDCLRSGKGKEQAEYIAERGLSLKTVTKFGIGASPDYSAVIEHLKSKGFTYEEMVESGVAGKNSGGRYFDYLGGRLIIPIIDSFNNVIGFCGRILKKKENVGKYLNTKETPVFSKGKTLFNINNLKKYKNANGLNEVIIVEGHMDVISLVQSGIENVVASMGTALTKDQARILKRYSNKVIISYDGDFAGRKATLRGLDILQDEGLEVKVVTLPDGMDPDDVVKKLGREYYENLIKEAMPLIDFKLNALQKDYDLNSADGKRKFIVSAVKVIKSSPSVVEQEDLLKTVRDATGTNLETLRREMENVSENAPIPSVSEAVLQVGTADKVTLAARFILYAYLFNREYVSETDIKSIEFLENKHKIIADYVISSQKESGRVNFSGLYGVQNDEIDEERNAIAAIESGRKDDFDEEMYFQDCVKTLKIAVLDKKLDNLSKLFRDSEDVAERREIAAKMNEIIAQKRAF